MVYLGMEDVIMPKKPPVVPCNAEQLAQFAKVECKSHRGTAPGPARPHGAAMCRGGSDQSDRRRSGGDPQQGDHLA